LTDYDDDERAQYLGGRDPLIRHHGIEAISVADREAAKHHKERDELTCAVWCWISRVTADFLRTEPEQDEMIH